jgi:Uma2 family endonuclease
MIIEHKQMTAAMFDELVARPENADRLFELIGGEMIEVPSNPYSSYIASRINRRLAAFVEDNALGYVTGEAGGYQVSGERYAPDVAFISRARQPELAAEGYNPTPPDLAVEVVSPSDPASKLTLKVANYLAAGTVVWVVYPATQTVEVYAPGQPGRALTVKDTLDGGAILPGFSLPVADIFPPSKAADSPLTE